MVVQRVVAVMGSPISSGNTASVVDTILNGAMGLSTNIILYHNLGKLNYAQGCRICDECLKIGSCVIKDDLTPILADITSADTLILATPVLFNMPSAQFKMVLDRFRGFISDTGVSTIAGKNCILVLVSDSLSDSNMQILELLADSAESFGLSVISKLIFSNEKGTVSFSDDKGAVKKAFKVGSDLYRQSEHPATDEITILNTTV